MADKTYSDLTTAEKVRVNAVILDGLEHSREFAKKLVDGSHAGVKNDGRKSSDDDAQRASNFQFLLDQTRNAMAKDIAQIPQVEFPETKHANKMDNAAALGLQQQSLRNIQGAIEAGASDASYIQKLAKNAQDDTKWRDNKSYELPVPNQEYPGLNRAIDAACKLSADCKKAVSAQERSSQDDTALTPDQVRARFEGVKGLGGISRRI